MQMAHSIGTKAAGFMMMYDAPFMITYIAV